VRSGLRDAEQADAADEAPLELKRGLEVGRTSDGSSSWGSSRVWAPRSLSAVLGRREVQSADRNRL